MWPFKKKAKIRRRRGVYNFDFSSTHYRTGVVLTFRNCSALVEELERIGQYSRIQILSVGRCEFSDAMQVIGDLVLTCEIEWEDQIAEGILEALGGK